MKVYAYARVSTQGQDLEVQINEIKKYCDYRKLELMQIYQDKATGKNTDRLGFQTMMEHIHTNALGIEAVVIFKLDRLGRSLIDLINITKALKDKNIGLISITNNIDTTSKEGRLFFYMMGALGEYERELIMERTSAGLKYAKERGVKVGRKPKNLSLDEINKQLIQGIPKTQIAKNLGVAVVTIYRRLAQKATITEKRII